MSQTLRALASAEKSSLVRNIRGQLGGNCTVRFLAGFIINSARDILSEASGLMILPESLCKTVSSMEELIHSVYGNMSEITSHENS